MLLCSRGVNKMHQGQMSTSKHQILKKKKKKPRQKNLNKQISFTLGMVSSSLHGSAPTDSVPGLDVPGDKGFKITENVWP